MYASVTSNEMRRTREVAALRSEVSPEKVYELLRRKVPGQAE